MIDTEYGHIIGGPADPDYDGAQLAADLTAGDTVLHVDNVKDFDEDGAERGALILVGVDLDANGNPDPATGAALPYLTCDDDANTVTLAGPSPVSVDSGDRVYIANPVTGLPQGELEVMVSMDDSDTTGDPLSAYVDLGLFGFVIDIDLTDQAVELDEDDDGQLVVARFPGLAQNPTQMLGYQDFATATGPGNITVDLTYRPVPNSTIHVYWGGLVQHDDEWTLSEDRWSVTLSDADGVIDAGDTIMVKYLYVDPATKPPVFASMILVGSEHVEDTSDFLDLPTGTLEGDLIVVALASRTNTGCNVPDARIEHSHAEIFSPGSPTMSSFIGYGTADSSGDPLPVTVPSGGRAEVAVFRIIGTVTDVYTPINGGGTPHTPTTLTSDMGITVLNGVVSLVPAPFSADTTGEWTTVSPGTDSGGSAVGGAATLIAYSLTGTPAGSWPGLDLGARWAALTIGLDGD